MRERMKKLSAMFAAVALAGTLVLGTSGKVEAAGVSYPRTLEETEAKWSQVIDDNPDDYTNNPSQVLELGNYLYIVGGGNLYKLNPSDGSVVAKKSGVANGMNVFLASNGVDTLYVQDSGYDASYMPYYNAVKAFSTSDLKEKWVSSITESSYGNSPLSYADGVVYGDHSGKKNTFFALDAATGATKWTKDIASGASNSAPIVVGNAVIYGDAAGTLYSYDKNDGTAINTLAVGDGHGIYSSLVRDGEYIYYITHYNNWSAGESSAELHKTKVGSNGLVSDDSFVTLPAGDSTTTPTIKNGKIYVGGSNAQDGIVAVYDTGLNLLDEKTVTGLGKTYNVVAVTDPSDTSNTLLYSAYFGSSNPDDYSIKDTGSVVELSEKNGKLTTPITFGALNADIAKNFSDAQITVGSNGTIYYSNDSGKLVALSAKKTVVPVPATDLTPVPSTTTEKTPVQVVDLSQGNTVLDAQSFTTILEENKTKDIVVKSDNNITFTFAKGSMKAVDGKTEYDFGTKIVEKYTKDLPSYISKNDFVKRINFNYSGELPGTALIKIPVGKEYVGQTLYYSLLKEGTQFAEAQAVTVDADGYITVSQSHCSDWVVTTNGPEQTSAKSPKTSDVNTVLPILVFVAAVAVLVVSTKKQA